VSSYIIGELEELYSEELIIGVDEAGVGSLAGPMTAAAVIMDPMNLGNGIKDSKKVSGHKRVRLGEMIKEKALYIGTCLISHLEVDSLGMRRASDRVKSRAAQQVLDQLAIDGVTMRPIVLVDGELFISGLRKVRQYPYPKGESRSWNIAAASIIATNTYEEWIHEVAEERWPRYGFSYHKGYGTREHMEKLLMYGPCPIHRRCLSPIRELLGEDKKIPHSRVDRLSSR